MKNLNTLLVIMALFITTIKTNAQDEKNPWAIGLGTNFIDVTPFGISKPFDQLKDYIGITKDINAMPLPNRLYVARYLKKGFILDLAGSFNSIDKIPSGDVPEKNYYSADLGLRYDLNHLFGESGWFDPYVKLAFGLAWVEDDNLAAISPTIGFNTWFNDKWGLNFETSYKASSLFDADGLGRAQYVGNYHYQHSISLVYSFGAKDSDKDGIIDKEDLCPEIPGSSELFGCPDDDGDGIANLDDLCPKLAGTKENKGCPDSDGDGVLDKDDNCPGLWGTAATNGCPDSDGDGVLDKDDDCPNKAGTAATNGCPDSDGDGVSDDKDNCPNEMGSEENKGCPALTSEERALIEESNFKFDFGKYEIKQGEVTSLDDVAALMIRVETIKLEVEGHTDSVGTEAYNVKLSEKRAQAVVKYFATKGIDASRLSVIGYGESKPVSSNKTVSGRADNRRVELNLIGK